MLKFFQISVLLLIASCAFSGRSSDKADGVTKYITGATAVDEVHNVHSINIFRAIGTPNNVVVLGRFKYYLWDYSRAVGVSTILGGGSTTFYCKLSAETQGEKIKTLTWYGNQCDIFLDRINDYFHNKLNIAIISEEDSKQQTTAPAPKLEKSEIKQEEKKEEVLPKIEPATPPPLEAAQPAVE